MTWAFAAKVLDYVAGTVLFCTIGGLFLTLLALLVRVVWWAYFGLPWGNP